MPQELTLFRKLQSHFNEAAKQYPAGGAMFEETLMLCKERLADLEYDKKYDAFGYPLFYKGLCHRVDQIEKSFEEGEKMMEVFWGAGKLIKEHKGPRI